MTTIDCGLEALDEDMLSVVTWAKKIKDLAVEDPDDRFKGDVPPHVCFIRDGFTVAFGWAPNVNRDEGLELARLGARAYGADQINFLVDAHMADDKFFKKYGRNPDPHELQNLCDNEGACEIGLITDTIVVARVTRVVTEKGRTGQVLAVSLPYHVDHRSEVLDKHEARAITGADRKYVQREGNTYTRSTRKTHWQDDQVWVFDDANTDGQMTGTVPAQLRAAFGPTLEDALAEHGVTAEQFGLTEHEARLHGDIASTRMIAGMGFPIMLGAKSDEDMAIIERSIARHRNVDGFRPDGTVVEKNPDDTEPLEPLLDLATSLRREQMAQTFKQIHEDELADAARRRAERAKVEYQKANEAP